MFLNVDVQMNGRMVPEYANEIFIRRRTAIVGDEWLIEMDERDEARENCVIKNRTLRQALFVTGQKLFASDTKTRN